MKRKLIGVVCLTIAMFGCSSETDQAGTAQRRTLVDGNTVVVVGEVTYTRQDGSTLTSQFADVWTMSGNKIQEYLIFIDNTEL